MSGRDLPWEDAIQRVLKDADGALHYSEIAERIVSQGQRQSVGATPAATIRARLSISLKEENSPFLRIGRGEYTLRESIEEKAEHPEPPYTVEEAEAGALASFGMFWRREAVSWKTTRPKLLGKQQAGASVVNFSEQVGIYLLHDHDRVVYVGRATDALSARLRAHTTDRLGGRWDRFSWFGLRGVNEEGVLKNDEAPWSQTVVIDTMEALLIESLEPPLNHKRGDNFSSVEYVQVPDPLIEKSRKEALLADLMSKL